MKRVFVFGGANVDIGGFSSSKAMIGDSNPGNVYVSVGGVGRNIAENLARLGIETQLVTALGNDENADRIRIDCEKSKIGLEYAVTFRDAHSSVYLFIADMNGDTMIAVNDMKIQERLTPECLMKAIVEANKADAVVIDANLSEKALAYIADNVRVPIIADAVSAAKIGKLKTLLPRLAVFKPNRIEAETLTGIQITDRETAMQAASKLNSMGIRRVFITLGDKGVCASENGKSCVMSNTPSVLVNASGAGDAFTAALVWASVEGMTLEECAKAGMAAASIAVESLETVNPEMSETLLRSRIR